MHNAVCATRPQEIQHNGTCTFLGLYNTTTLLQKAQASLLRRFRPFRLAVVPGSSVIRRGNAALCLFPVTMAEGDLFRGSDCRGNGGRCVSYGYHVSNYLHIF